MSDDEIRELLIAGRKIDAIKLVRRDQHLDLKDAKDYVERIGAAIDPALLHPPGQDRSRGCVVFLLYAAGLGALIYAVIRLSV